MVGTILEPVTYAALVSIETGAAAVVPICKRYKNEPVRIVGYQQAAALDIFGVDTCYEGIIVAIQELNQDNF